VGHDALSSWRGWRLKRGAPSLTNRDIRPYRSLHRWDSQVPISLTLVRVRYLQQGALGNGLPMICIDSGNPDELNPHARRVPATR